MVRKFTFGRPFPTDAVVKTYPAQEGTLPYFTNTEESLVLTLEKGAPVYGLGEQVRGINKRGWIYTSNCTDNPHHTETTRSLYGAHNFLIIGGASPFGIFIDYPGTLTFDIGYTRSDTLRITPEDWNLDIYLIETEDHLPASIVHTFRQMIGRSYIPPKWAFGYGQSRWGYKNEADFREVAETYAENGFPLDAIYMDIDYMERYKDFTVSRERFPDFPGLVNDLKEQGVHLVPIIDAGGKDGGGISRL